MVPVIGIGLLKKLYNLLFGAKTDGVSVVDEADIIIDTTPDAPVSFGYKISWLALKTEDTEAVLDVIPIDNPQIANWKSGIDSAYGDNIFISPPIEGWTLVVGSSIPQDEDLSGALASLLSTLSSRFGEAQYFGTHRVVEYHAWALHISGEETRAFAYLGERGEYLADRGNKTDSELDLGYDYFRPEHPDANTEEYWDREDLEYVDEEHVMELADKWSINPLTLDSLTLPEGVGWVGRYRKQ